MHSVCINLFYHRRVSLKQSSVGLVLCQINSCIMAPLTSLFICTFVFALCFWAFEEVDEKVAAGVTSHDLPPHFPELDDILETKFRELVSIWCRRLPFLHCASENVPSSSTTTMPVESDNAPVPHHGWLGPHASRPAAYTLPLTRVRDHGSRPSPRDGPLYTTRARSDNVFWYETLDRLFTKLIKHIIDALEHIIASNITDLSTTSATTTVATEKGSQVSLAGLQTASASTIGGNFVTTYRRKRKKIWVPWI